MATLSLYFNGYSTSQAWSNDPANMVDSSETTYASTTTSGQTQYLNSNTYTDAVLGTITKVEIRCYGYKSGGLTGAIVLQPVFAAGNGTTQTYTVSTSPAWSQWYDITSITNAPNPWTWADVIELDCNVIGYPASTRTIYCGKVELRITYTELSVPTGTADAAALSPTVSGESSGMDGEVFGVTASSSAIAYPPQASGECSIGPPPATASADALAPETTGNAMLAAMPAAANAAVWVPTLFARIVQMGALAVHGGSLGGRYRAAAVNGGAWGGIMRPENAIGGAQGRRFMAGGIIGISGKANASPVIGGNL